MRVVNVAIAGCGVIARMMHIPAIKKCGGKIVGLYDVNEEVARACKHELCDEDTKIYSTYKDLLSDEKVEAVYILTPNCFHALMTIEALKADKHVFCEKPMAISYEESLAVLEAMEKSKGYLTIGYQNRYRPENIYLKKECDNKRFGEIYFAKAKALRRRKVPTWGSFFDKDLQGGGVLIDFGTHALDLALYIIDNYEPDYCVGTTYCAFGDKKQTGNDWGDWDDRTYALEDSAFGFVVMKNGATLILESSWALNINDEGGPQILISGTKSGADTFDGLKINGVKNNRQFTEKVDISKKMISPMDIYFNEYDKECETFFKAIKGEGELVVSAKQASVVCKIIDGIYKSALTRKPYFFK